MNMGFNAENHVKNLPDVYKKTADSNNFKILEIERITNNHTRETLWSIDNILDINNAKGKTLDLYGERVGQPRGVAPDEKYILMIKAKIMRNLSDGSYQSVIDAICATLGCEQSQVILIESENKPCTVESVEIPLDVVINAGFTSGQITQILKSLMPVGVAVEMLNLEGTFELGAETYDYKYDENGKSYADEEYEYDENAGFGNEEQTTGGYFGYVAGEKEEVILPI